MELLSRSVFRNESESVGVRGEIMSGERDQTRDSCMQGKYFILCTDSPNPHRRPFLKLSILLRIINKKRALPKKNTLTVDKMKKKKFFFLLGEEYLLYFGRIPSSVLRGSLLEVFEGH